jgi:hypothetical protein
MPTRRKFLKGAGAAAAAGLAGCTGSQDQQSCTTGDSGYRIHIYAGEDFDLEENDYVKTLEDNGNRDSVHVDIDEGQVWITAGNLNEYLNESQKEIRYEVGSDQGKTVRRHWSLDSIPNETKNGWYYLDTWLEKEGWFSSVPENSEGLCKTSEEVNAMLEEDL